MPLLATLARIMERAFGDIKAQELANTAQAYATPALSDALLLAALARILERRLGDFNA